MSSRKISGYSRDFKLKVLEYYFKHGGDKKFGLRAKTAHHFCIDHKTVSRMLCNPDIVKKARRTLAKKNSSPGCKPLKPPTLKSMGQPFGEVKETGKTAATTEGSQTSPPGPSRSQGRSISSEQKTRSSVEVPVIELPEDPDFSILKRTIESSASASANFARLLITGTNEVKRIVMNECDLIFECKVCRNLFRSIVNFLAHKRVYCQEEYANVKSLFYKDSGLNMTNESSTVIVEPKSPPSEGSNPDSGQQPGKCELKIDQIASQLAKNKKKSSSSQELSSSIHTGSSAYYDKLQKVNELRKSMNTNCSVLLQDIAGISTAVYQTFIPPKCDKLPEDRTQEAVREIHQRKRAQPIQLDSEGKVVKKKEIKLTPTQTSSRTSSVSKESKDTEEERIFLCSSCTSIFSSQLLLDSHVEEVHGIERSVYTCPICNMIFLTIWGCVKHLIRIHKKKKHQRERLKHVICSRAYKKIFTKKDIAKLTHKSYTQVTNVIDKDEITTTTSPSKEVTKEGISSRINLPAEEESSTFLRHKTSPLPHTCPRCGQAFQTSTAMGAHLQFCPLASLQTNLQSETPEKKIAIQIRKDYTKETVGSQPMAAVQERHPDDKTSLEIQARIKEVCAIDRLFCIPCKRRYHTITVLKRHAAHHLGWTRFVCIRCSFRSYDKYMCTQHCLTAHRATEKSIEQMVVRDEKMGTFKYHLSSVKGSKESSENSSKSDLEDNDRKADYLHNGDCSSPSECSASVISEDSSFKGEFENQDLESANVAYRELIENVDIGVDIKEAKAIQDKRERKENRENEFKAERPQRTRKTVEQKDFVYELVRTPSSSSRSDDDSKPTTGSSSSRHRSTSQSFLVEAERSTKRKGVTLVKEPSKRLYDSRTSSPCLEISQKICNGRESPLVESVSSSFTSFPNVDSEIKEEFPERETIEVPLKDDIKAPMEEKIDSPPKDQRLDIEMEITPSSPKQNEDEELVDEKRKSLEHGISFIVTREEVVVAEDKGDKEVCESERIENPKIIKEERTVNELRSILDSDNEKISLSTKKAEEAHEERIPCLKEEFPETKS